MRSCHARTTPDCLPDLSRRDEPGRDRTAAGIRLGQRRTPAPGSAAFYRIQVLGERSEAVPSSAGIRICADLAWRDCPPESLDTLLVPGGLGVEAQTRNADLLAWLKAAEPRIRRLGSVCSGALILAAAGVLDGHPATTHWADVATLRQGFPASMCKATACTPTTRSAATATPTSSPRPASRRNRPGPGAGRGRPRPQPGAQRRATPGDVPQASWRPGPVQRLADPGTEPHPAPGRAAGVGFPPTSPATCPWKPSPTGPA